MRAFSVAVGASMVLAILASPALAQELRLELARKRQAVERPTVDAKVVVREADRAVEEYREQVARERLIEAERDHERRRQLDSLITEQKQVLAVQRALREFRR